MILDLNVGEVRYLKSLLNWDVEKLKEENKEIPDSRKGVSNDAIQERKILLKKLQGI